ncbi:MAG: hypothetical protein ACTHL1_01210 [Burkholderiaceae bacterium]
MNSGELVYLRTESGREEIHNKSHGLTQSERLVLILIDGVTSVVDLRAKLKGLTEERFDRALATLIDRQFVAEILLRFDGAMPEKVAEDIVEKFLHQDDLDPVTIISYDPEEEFGADAVASSLSSLRSAVSPKIDLKQWVNREDALQEDGRENQAIDFPAELAPTAGLPHGSRKPDLLLEEKAVPILVPSSMEEAAAPTKWLPVRSSRRRAVPHSSIRPAWSLVSSHWRQYALAIGLGFLLFLCLRVA